MQVLDVGSDTTGRDSASYATEPVQGGAREQQQVGNAMEGSYAAAGVTLDGALTPHRKRSEGRAPLPPEQRQEAQEVRCALYRMWYTATQSGTPFGTPFTVRYTVRYNGSVHQHAHSSLVSPN